MKNNKSNADLEAECFKLYGGLNTNPHPFKLGDRVRQIYRLDDSDDICLGGREEFEFCGMKGKLMLLKSLNEAAAYNIDTLLPEVIALNKANGFQPIIGSIYQLHYMFADRYQKITC